MLKMLLNNAAPKRHFLAFLFGKKQKDERVFVYWLLHLFLVCSNFLILVL